MLFAIAASRACADVRSISLNECFTNCILAASDGAAAGENEPDADIALSLFGGGRANAAHDVRPDLILDPKALPPLLVTGLPSPIAAIAADTPAGPGVSPYAFFDQLINAPLAVDPRTGLAAASIGLFAPSLIGRLTLTDVLSDSRDLFKPLPPPVRPAM